MSARSLGNWVSRSANSAPARPRRSAPDSPPRTSSTGYVGGIFETALADPDLAPRLEATGLILPMQCTEPDSALVIDLPGHQAHRGDHDDEHRDRQRVLAGQVNLTFVMARGKVEVDGTVTKLLQLAPLAKKLFPVYVERLRADGRNDLVVG